ncbi:MAG: pilus assembly protein TadG-related protein, partial [Planctomycetota bacterium]
MKTTYHRSSALKRRGIAYIWFIIMGMTLIAFVGLAIEVSYVLLTANQLQNAVDAASLAGASKVQIDEVAAREKATTIAEANTAAKQSVELDPNDIILGYFDRDTSLFDPLASSYNAVKVVARRTDGSASGAVPLLFFGPLFGVDDANVVRSAIAMIGGGFGAGFLILDPRTTSCALRFSGNNALTLENAPGYEGEAAIQVNSNDPCALCASGSSLVINATETNIVGDACFNGNPTLNTEINPDSPEVPDPLKDLPDPPYGPPDLGSITTSGTYPPGYYSGG